MLRCLLRGLLVCAALAFVAGGCRPSQSDCEKACWNHAELAFWEMAEKEIELAPEGEREALRAKKKAEWEAMKNDEENPRPKICAELCVKQGRKEEVKCLIAAKTAEEARKCTE